MDCPEQNASATYAENHRAYQHSVFNERELELDARCPGEDIISLSADRNTMEPEIVNQECRNRRSSSQLDDLLPRKCFVDIDLNRHLDVLGFMPEEDVGHYCTSCRC